MTSTRTTLSMTLTATRDRLPREHPIGYAGCYCRRSRSPPPGGPGPGPCRRVAAGLVSSPPPGRARTDIERDEHTMVNITGQARKWIYPRLGATKLKDLSATDADKFFQQIAPSLRKRSLVIIKSTLPRSIRRAQVHDIIGRNVIELIDLPSGKPGRPSRAMTEAQAGKLLKTARGTVTGYTRVVKASNGRYAVTHAATETGQLACGTQPHKTPALLRWAANSKETTCRSCRRYLGL